ncbi:MAG TPA: glycosyltransferase family 39 protein [Candidatus Hydrogenedens sp.]|nr:glycosyltransferase family 39 protein [Candidatus Hydrogenedens sp.]HOL21148.1 glycosyltransferase family 39 protein [Candidatus Hydrogenedens sp.]HPP58268.1 glycosyltransferase family 39 protein [Candidatus Hydrogenedens sp.]
MNTIKKYYLIIILFLISVIAIISLPQKPSLWGDELLGGVLFTEASSAIEFLTVQGSVGPEVAPIYPLLLYFNAKYLHIPLNTFRYFSVLCCLFSSLFIYLSISKFASSKIAFLTSVSVALVPIHLWYSMLLRPHALAFLLSTISFYFFTLINNDHVKVKYLLILCFINVILIFTHYIFFWIPLAESLFLILNRRINKRNILFLFLNSTMIGFVIFYLGFFIRTNNIEFAPEKGIKQIFLFIFSVMDYEIPSMTSWGILIQPLFFVHRQIPPWLNHFFEYAPKIVVYSGNCLLSLLLLYLLAKELFYIIKNKTLPKNISCYLLFFGVIMPICFGLIQIILGINISMVRYFYLSFICKIALLYIFLIQIRNKNLYRFLTTITVLFFIHQFIIYRACLPYSDWDTCAKYINERTIANDIIITGRFEEAVTLKYAMPNPNTTPILYSTSIKSAIDGILDLQHKNPSSTIWLIYSMQWNFNMPCILREELKKRDINFHEKVFPSFEGIASYEIPPKIQHENNKTTYDAFYNCNPEYQWEDEKKNRKDKMLKILEQYRSHKLNNESLLDWLVFPDGSAGLNTTPQLTFQLIAMDKKNEAQGLFRHFSNQTIWANIALILFLTETGQLTTAEEIFIPLAKRNIYLACLLKPIWKNYAEGKYSELLEQCHQLKKAGFPLAYLLETIVQLKTETRSQKILQSGLFPLNNTAKILLLN